MTTMRPRASSSWTRKGRTSTIRASTWRSFVMMPDWLPVKLIASPPSSRIAIESRAIAIRSPAVSSMSSSRRSGFGDTCLASDSSSSVVSPIAETTTTTSWPSARVFITRSATLRILVTSATLEPPYFWTTIAITSIENCHHRRVVAGSHVFLHRTRRRACGQRFARHHVVEAPADVALAHVAPRRPPGEQAVVVGIKRPSEVDETAAQDAFDERALLGKLADGARLSFLRMDVALGARHVHVAHHDERSSAGLERRGIAVHRFQELHLGGEVLAAVRDVHRRHGQISDRDRHDA